MKEEYLLKFKQDKGNLLLLQWLNKFIYKYLLKGFCLYSFILWLKS